RAQQARARAPHRRVRSVETTPGQRERQGAGGGGEATEDRVSAAEVTPWKRGKFVRPVVITKRNQAQSPTRGRLPCAVSNHRTKGAVNGNVVSVTWRVYRGGRPWFEAHRGSRDFDRGVHWRVVGRPHQRGGADHQLGAVHPDLRRLLALDQPGP